MDRTKPNILITGTPGVGKSTLCAELLKSPTEDLAGVQYKWYDINKIARDRDCYDGYDDELQCDILNEDRVMDELEPRMADGGAILEYHGCDFFPERWFDAVFVLRTDNTILYDRLKARGYHEDKIRNNVQCEIFQTILEEASDAYNTDIVHQLTSNNDKDMEDNIQTVKQWTVSWINNRNV